MIRISDYVRPSRYVSKPVEVGVALAMSAAAAWWWFSLPKEERDEFLREVGKLINV